MPDSGSSPPPSELAGLHDLMDELDARIDGRPRPDAADGEPPDEPFLPQRHIEPPRWRLLHLILFVATCLSTFYVGGGSSTLTILILKIRAGEVDSQDTERLAAAVADLDRLSKLDGSASNAALKQAAENYGEAYDSIREKYIDTDEWWRSGLMYAGAVMLILLSHEMGHYLQARRYHVPASPPYFIPMPFSPFGTFGAVIVQRAGFGDRKKLYDIAISGPLAGLVLALPVAWYGVTQSILSSPEELASIAPEADSISYGDPLLLQWMYSLVHGRTVNTDHIILNPLLFAGWVGIFITALNLIPISQLDGGHVLYALIGKRAHVVAMALLYGTIGYMILTNNYQYMLMVLLLILIGPRHPPTADDTVPLGTFRIVLGWLTLAFIIIGFTPVPMKM